MIGPDGVGKTTLLATMYHELSKIDNHFGFEFIANKDTQLDLQEAYQKLNSIIAQPTFTPTGSLLKGTSGLVERQFEIRFMCRKELDLEFCDIAGGVLRAKTGQDFEEFQEKLAQAIVIINVIDGSAFVKGAENKNDPQQIYDHLLPTLSNGQNHLILFVITKCEAWLKTEHLKKKLEHVFETKYAMLLKYLNTLDNVAGILIPVKTLGCVEFTHVDHHRMIFVRKPNLQFKPEHIDQPLRYALAFALQEHNHNRGKWSKLMRWLWSTDLTFQQSLIDFAEDRAQVFKIYGNPSLIEVKTP